MAAKEVWKLLSKYTDKRCQFREFCYKYKQRHGRAVMIAVDAFIWIVAANSKNVQGYRSRLLLNIQAMIRELISMDVSFVLVFDGDMKPSFKRSSCSNLESRDFNQEYEFFKNNTHEYVEKDPQVRSVKQLLTAWGIEWHQAHGEGEAECARLQREGIVDYVMTNDSDSLIFGATRVLKNFSKFKQDKPPTASDTPEKTYYVTVVDMEEITRRSGFNRDQLLFFSVLKGGDYHKGIGSLGMVKAAKLAQLDVHKEFVNVFRAKGKQLIDLESREQKYTAFKNKFQSLLETRSAEIFGRNETVSSTLVHDFPPDIVVMSYFYPFVNFKTSFKFTKATHEAPKDDFKQLLEFLLDANLPLSGNFYRWFQASINEAYLVKQMLYGEHTPCITISREKLEDVPLVLVKYTPYILRNLDNLVQEFDTSPKRESLSTWIYKPVLESTLYYRDFLTRSPSRRSRSPSRSPTKQSSTLVSMGFLDSSVKTSPRRSPLKRTSGLTPSNALSRSVSDLGTPFISDALKRSVSDLATLDTPSLLPVKRKLDFGLDSARAEEPDRGRSLGIPKIPIFKGQPVKPVVITSQVKAKEVICIESDEEPHEKSGKEPETISLLSEDEEHVVNGLSIPIFNSATRS